MDKVNGTPRVQKVLDELPVLPEEAWVTDLAHQLTAPMSERNGFYHSSGEWQILYEYKGSMYRLPESMAIIKLNRQRKFN